MVRIEPLAHHAARLRTVAAWQQAQFGHLSPSVTVADRIERLRASCEQDALPLTWVALTDVGEPLGCASLVLATLTHRHLGPWLSAVFVVPEHRRSGIASALALRALDECRRRGFDKLYLFTPCNAALYARLGWQVMDTARISGVPVAVMERLVGLR